MKRVFLVFLLALLLPAAVPAVEPFTVKDIRIEGLQRISAGTVFNYLPIKVGDRVDEAAVTEAIRALFKTGFFKDISLRRDGEVLVVTLVERPSIARIEIVGNKEFSEETIREGMKRAGLAEGRVFNRSALERVEQELRTQYFALGKYNTTLTTTLTPLERNRVSVTLEIDEGERARIKSINIVGNKAFSDEKLLKRFSLGKRRPWALFSRRDRYSKQKLAADLEKLRSFYQDNGYLDFEIESTQVSISPDKRDIYVTVNITEGEKYTISEYKFGGKTILPEDELRRLVTFAPGDVFSRKEVAASSKNIAERLANDGYAFANVNPIPDVDKERHTVAFTFFVDPGRRVYVRRINIYGNTTTRDEVIRRELRQLEGAWFSAKAVRRSRIRLQRLGFFEDVNIETPAVPGTPDQIDVDITVKERPTGNLLFGIGYSDAEGLLLQASVSQRNLFGTGKELYLNVDNSQVTDVFNIRYVNPYYTVHGISRGINLSSTRIDAEKADTAEYITETVGGGLSYKIPISEYNSVNLGVALERIDLERTGETPPEILGFIRAHPTNDVLKATASWAHDTRDSFIFPTRGWLHRIALETSVPDSDLEYYKIRYITNFYAPFGRRLVLKVGGELGYGDGYGKLDELPFFKNFFAGGAASVRGYKARSLGPRDSGATPSPLGGSSLILGSIELLFPVPGIENGKDKRLSLFVDAGQVYGAEEDVDVGELRYSAGLAFSWFSPLGPLSISIAEPLNDKPGDKLERFQFTLGRLFR